MARHKAFASRLDARSSGTERWRGLAPHLAFGSVLLVLVPVIAGGPQSLWGNGGQGSQPSWLLSDDRDTEDEGAGADLGPAASEALSARTLDLASRGSRLERRAAMIDTLLVGNDGGRPRSTCRPPPAGRAPASRSLSPAGLRLTDGSAPLTPGESDAPTPDAVAERIDALEARQAATVLCLSERVSSRMARGARRPPRNRPATARLGR